MKKTFLALLTALVMAIPAMATENCCHNMAGGTFGVAWIDSTGEVRVFDGQKSVRLLRFYEKGTQLATMDYNGDGRDALAVISVSTRSLFVIDVDATLKSGKATILTSKSGSNVCAISTGAIQSGSTQGTLVASTPNSSYPCQATFLWDKSIGQGAWTPLGGTFSQASCGKLKANQPDQFVVVESGDVYTLNPNWNAYSPKLMGKNIKGTICGNFVATTPEDEIVAASEDNTYLLIGKKVDPLDKVVKCMTVGKTADKALLIAVDKDGKLCQYDRSIKTWTNLAENVTGFVSVITVPNADGTYTIYARTIDGLYRISADGKTAELVDGQLKTRVTLKAGGRTIAAFQPDGRYKPYIEQLYTPSGVQVVWDSPIEEHYHHHALMYSLSLNDANFWEEHGNDCSREVVTKLDSTESSIKAELDWVSYNGTVLAKEVREISVEATAEGNVLNWKTTLTPADKAITVCGTHYYGLGMRFHKDMNTTVKFFNSTGVHDGEIVRGDERLKDVEWVGAKGTINGKPITVQIFDQKGNTRPLTAYTMGEAWKSFAYMGATMRVHQKPIQLEPGQSLTAAYKILVKDGE